MSTDNVVQLNKHLDTQGMSLEEEVELEKAIERELGEIIDNRIVDVCDDETVDASIKNEASWRDLAALDYKKPFDELTASEVMHMAERAYIHVTNIEADMRESLRCVAEEAVR